MQKQEDEKLERRLHQVMERIQPDEDAKDRMYLEIMRRASVAETPPAKPKPWYLRWQTSAGACTAALLCVVVVAAAVHGRMPQGGTGQLDIVSPTVTTQASELPATTASSVETVPIRQNIYLYYKLTWEGNPYDTDYMEVSSSSLDQYLGYGVTRGNDVEDTYTVLIYSIVGVDPVQQVAVQYAGEEKYYVFTIQ